MTCIIYYFTGSGNTRICAQDLKRHLEEEKIATDLYEFKEPNSSFPDPDAYDIIGIGYPIHAFNVPKPFLKFIKSFKKTNKPDKRVFIFKVSGEPFKANSASSYWLVKHLKDKGYKPTLEKHFLMPYNIMFRYKEEIAKQMYLYLDALTKMYSLKIERNQEEKMKFPLKGHLYSFFFRIEWIAGPVNHFFVFFSKKRCLNCNKCLLNCPNQAIYRNKKGRLKVNSSCSLCMRCTINCPKDAIHFGFMNHWKVNPNYNYQKEVEDKNLSGDYINQNTKGYFHHFYPYFKKQDEELKEYGINPPLKTDNR
jgi:flavodoxin/Pyruvate/2-oxoacid:ferredoxin oxidoreductase delta subunit